MTRIVIELPDRFPFATELDICIGHINNTGHLDNVQLLSLVSEARARFLAALGYREDGTEGIGTIVTDAALQYCSESFWGERVIIRMDAANFNKYGCDLMWRMTEKTSGREIARGKTGIVFFDYDKHKIHPMPLAFIEKAGAMDV